MMIFLITCPVKAIPTYISSVSTVLTTPTDAGLNYPADCFALRRSHWARSRDVSFFSFLGVYVSFVPATARR